jgi:hypothetical protein
MLRYDRVGNMGVDVQIEDPLSHLSKNRVGEPKVYVWGNGIDAETKASVVLSLR